MRFSLRTVLVALTCACALIAFAVTLYESRFGRNRRAHEHFKSLQVHVAIGDPCPSNFIYCFDGDGRGDGLPANAFTPDLWEQLLGRKLSYPPVRELGFNTQAYSLTGHFSTTTVDQVVRLAPELECFHAPPPTVPEELMPACDYDLMIAQLCKLQSVRWLSLSSWPLTDSHFQQLQKLPKLQVLGCRGSDEITDGSLEQIARMSQLRCIGIRQARVSAEKVMWLQRVRPDLVASIAGHRWGDRSQLYVHHRTPEAKAQFLEMDTFRKSQQ